MKLTSVCFALVFGIVLFHQINATGVIDLTDENYDSVYGKGQHWIIMYFAPWCGHCKKMKPFFLEASQMKSKLKFGSVDCTQHKAICEKVGVRGYPTIKLLNESTMTPYQGGRTTEAFLSLSRKVNDGVVKPVTNGNFASFSAQRPTSFLLMLAEGDDRNESISSTFSSVADNYLISPISFGSTSDSSVIFSAGLTQEDLPAIKVFGVDQNENRQVTQIQGTFGIQGFIDDNKFPYLTELNQDYFRAVSASERKLGLLAVNPNDQSHTETISALRQISKSGKYSDIVFTYLDYNTSSRELKPYEVVEEDLPQLIIVDTPNKQFYKQNKETSALSGIDLSAQLITFLNDVQSGDATASSYGSGGGISQFLNENTLLIGLGIFVAIAVILTVVLMCMPDEEKPVAAAATKKANQKSKQD